MKVETLPLDINNLSRKPINFDRHSKKSLTEPEILFENNLNFEFTPRLKVSKTKNNFFLEKWLRLQNLRWKYFFFDILLKEICVISILILLIETQIYIQEYLNCKMDNSNIPLVIYTIFREFFFVISYYLLFAYYAFKLSWPHALDKKTTTLCLVLFFLLYLLKIYKIDSNGNYLDCYLVAFIVQWLRVIMVYRKQLILWENMKIRNFPLFSLLCFCLMFNHYGMKNLFIPSIKEFCINFVEDSLLGSFIFQVILFIYFRIYYKFFFYILMMYANLSNDSMGKDCLVMFSKYFLIDAVCSSIPGAVIGSLHNTGAWLGIFNFIYQLLVLYDQNFDILRYVKVLFWKIFKKTTKISKSNQQEKYVREILKMALSNVLIIIGVHLILWFYFRKAMVRLTLVKNCDFSLKEFVVIRIENIVVSSLIMFLFMIGLAIRKNDPLKFDWELESYGFFTNFIYIIMLHFLVDNHLQYYFSFYYLKINNSLNNAN